MIKQHYIFGITSLLFLFSGCNNSNTTNTADEFISLDKKANFEHGYILAGKEKIELAYTGELIYQPKASIAPQYIGAIGIFSENNPVQILAISSDNGMRPNYKEIFINIPDIPNGYICRNNKVETSQSNIINDASIYTLNLKQCEGHGINIGKIQDFVIKLTDSMFNAGTSQIEIKGFKAYLNTDYRINEKLLLFGGLGTRAYNQIFDLVHHHPEVKTLVEGHISGSINDDINMQTGRLVRKHKLALHITKTSDIASGGVDLFCSGIKRTMEDGAKVGVHSWSDEKGTEAGKLPIDSKLHLAQINYFTEMLGSPIGKKFYFYTINAAPADGIYQMNRAEMKAYNLLKD
jgi:hypothetical protein